MKKPAEETAPKKGALIVEKAVEKGAEKTAEKSAAKKTRGAEPLPEALPEGRDLPELEKSLGYTFHERKFLRNALIHRSYANEHRLSVASSNERLEFLGDAVLELVVSHAIMDLFPAFAEGGLSKLRASVVNEQNLSRLARKVHLGSFLFLGKGEARSGGREKASILADAYEAVLAAIYLDGGLPAAEAVVKDHFQAVFNKIEADGYDRDFKTLLQEECQARFKVTPEYRLVEARGPDHQKEFTVSLAISGNVVSEGKGRTKKQAEQRAAAAAMATLAAGAKS